MSTATTKDVAIESPATTPLRVETLEVDEEQARAWLETMAHNRPISRVNLEGLMLAMLEGRWHQDGSAIKFDKEGRLIDGQHRLWSVINTGKSQTFLVVFGVDPAAMTTLDTGKVRTRGDVLSIHDPTLMNVNHVAAAVTIMLRWHKGARNNNLRNDYVSNDEVIQFYDSHREEIMEAQRHGGRLAKSIAAGSAQAYALCYWLFSEKEAEDAEFFWDRLVDGQALSAGNPIYALREMLRREAGNANTRDKLRADIIAALIIKAWNAYRKGEEVKLLHFKVGGAHPERYPEPV